MTHFWLSQKIFGHGFKNWGIGGGGREVGVEWSKTPLGFGPLSALPCTETISKLHVTDTEISTERHGHDTEINPFHT